MVPAIRVEERAGLNYIALQNILQAFRGRDRTGVLRGLLRARANQYSGFSPAAGTEVGVPGVPA